MIKINRPTSVIQRGKLTLLKQRVEFVTLIKCNRDNIFITSDLTFSKVKLKW